MCAMSASRDRAAGKPIREPVLKVNRYDQISAGMISIVMGLGVGVLSVFLWWLTTRPPVQEFLVPMEMMASPAAGGSEFGAIDETLKIESPEPVAENASNVEEASSDADVVEMLETATELAEQASQQAQQVMLDSAATGGAPGSALGTGRRALGSGPGEGGIPNEQRWFIRYADDSSLAEYGRELDYFGLELGALLPDGQLVYLKNFSTGTPVKRTASSGKGEQRLYMTWQGGARKQADVQLFAAAGVDASKSVLFHFYPPAAEQLLLRKEYAFAGRKAQEIRRTYFVVVKQGTGYDFVVTRQTPLR
jgi:hypothetical protein